MTYLDVMAGLWTRAGGSPRGSARARCGRSATSARARGWLTSGKRPRAVWEERDARTGAWVARPLWAMGEAAQRAVREVIATRGWCLAPGVETVRFTFAAGLVVRMRDGRVFEVDVDEAAGGRRGA